MADLTAEQFGQLPDFLKGDYEQNGEVYRHRSEGKFAAVKKTADDLDAKNKGYEKTIADIQAKKAEEIEKARNDALEQARNKGDVSAIEKRYKEQMEDLQKRSDESKAQYEERIKARDDRFVKSERESLLSKIRGKLGIFEKVGSKFDKLIGSRIEIDTETGEAVFLDENGGATTQNLEGFISDLDKDESLDFWREDDSSRGGKAKGNNAKGQGGARNKWSDYSDQELSDIQRTNPDKYNQLKQTR